MSAASHTPGPWKAQISADFVGGNSYSIFTAHENRSAQVQDLVAASFPGTVHGHGPANISGPEARANAALIAAAPDLLEALQDLLDGHAAGAITGDDLDGARRAIAKATGAARATEGSV